MNKLIYFIICFTITLQSCNGQTTPKKEIYNQDFNWTITIPENFQNVSAEEWAKLQNKGAEAIEKTYEEEVINQSKTIFVFKSDQFNYFESNYQYETFKAQMPNIKIDTTKTVEKIDDLEFQTFKMKIEYPNKMVFNVLMYSRLFDKKEFTVNIMYVDNKKGQLMLEAWKKSKFTK